MLLNKERAYAVMDKHKLDGLLAAQRQNIYYLTDFFSSTLKVERHFTMFAVLPRREEFIGLDNYAELVRDDIFWRAVRNTVTWAVASPLIEVSIALLLALALYAKVPGARFFRVAWFTPVLMSYPVVGVIWLWVYNYDWGMVNLVLRAVGLGQYAQAWLASPATALPALILVTTWMFAGFNMVVLLAAIHAIPAEYLEAARVDGASGWRRTWHIVIPLIRPTLVNLAILDFIGKMKQFALVWVMTRGGPMWGTETVATYVIKRAFEWKTLDLGYPSAIAVLWFVIIFGLSYGLTRLLQRREALQF